jgi:hypothetical protein
MIKLKLSHASIGNLNGHRCLSRPARISALVMGALFWASAGSSAGAAPIKEEVAALLSDTSWCYVEEVQTGETGYWTTFSGPGSIANPFRGRAAAEELANVNRVTRTGAGEVYLYTPYRKVRLHRVPCPPLQSAQSYQGLNLLIQAMKARGFMDWTESSAATGAQTNSGSASGDPLGVGIGLGYGLHPWNNALVVDPFVSIEIPNIKVRQYFPGGSYLGTRSRAESRSGYRGRYLDLCAGGREFPQRKAYRELHPVLGLDGQDRRRRDGRSRRGLYACGASGIRTPDRAVCGIPAYVVGQREIRSTYVLAVFQL